MQCRSMRGIVQYMKPLVRVWNAKDKDVAEALGIKAGTLASAIRRDGILYKELMVWCVLNDVDMKNLFYLSDKKITKEMVLNPRGLKQLYWVEEMPAVEIAKEIGMSEGYVYSLIEEYGLGKKENNIKLRGKKGYVMPVLEKQRHKKQPQSKWVLRLSLTTNEVLERYGSIQEAVQDGYRADRIKEVNRRKCFSHRGFRWRIEEKMCV